MFTMPCTSCTKIKLKCNEIGNFNQYMDRKICKFEEFSSKRSDRSQQRNKKAHL